MKCAFCSTPLPDNSRYCFSCGADVADDPDEKTQRIEEDPELVTLLQEDLHGEYIIDELLQRGGMAAVFLARDSQLGRKVAIKVLPPELSHGQGAVARFKREARTAAALDHPHIVPIHRISTTGRLFWYVMKFVDGESLAQVLQREGALPPPQAANIIGQTAEALDFAHKKGVVHRDVKPDNIMIDARGWVTMMDFGIAKAVDRPGLTGGGATIGTPYYMSPEQCAGAHVAPAADQYGLGVVAYRMLSDQLPFRGDTILAVVQAQISGPVPPLPPSVPAPLAAVVARALSKRPGDRFPSVLEFADAFARAARRDPTPNWDARRAGPSRSGPAAATPSGSGPRVRVPGWLRAATGGGRRAARVLSWVAGLAVLGIAAAIARPGGQIVPDSSLASPTPPTPPTPPAAPPAAVPAPATDTGPVRRPVPRAAAPAPAAAQAYVTVGSQPLAALTINGRRTSGNPVANFAVPAGPVLLHFQVRDASGDWSFDTTVTVQAGERRNLGRLRLARRAQ